MKSIALLVLLAFASQSGALAQSTNFSGEWKGTWTGGSTHDVYLPNLMLTVDAQGNATGAINWTLQKAGQPDQAGKEGKTGVENVSGHVEGHELILDGVSVDDPNHILGRDAYRLVLSDDGNTLGGITSNGGTWTGLFYAKRQ